MKGLKNDQLIQIKMGCKDWGFHHLGEVRSSSKPEFEKEPNKR